MQTLPNSKFMSKAKSQVDFAVLPVQLLKVPCVDANVYIRWKRGNKDKNKGVFPMTQCVNHTIIPNFDAPLRVRCTIETRDGAALPKPLKLAVYEIIPRDRQKEKLDEVGFVVIDLAKHASASGTLTLRPDFSGKYGKFKSEIKVTVTPVLTAKQKKAAAKAEKAEE